MALGLTGLTQGVAGYVEELFNAAGPRIVQDTGEILRDGVPIPGYIVPAIGVEIGRRACRRYADNASVFDGSTGAAMESLCRPYLDDIGYGEPAGVDLPFRGGQCVQKYIVTFSFGGANPGDNQGTILVFGPIEGIREEPQGDGTNRVFLRANSGGIFGGQCFNILGPSGSQDIFLGSYTPASGAAPQIDGIAPCGSDNCGNPPPVVRDPVPPPVPTPPTAPFNPAPNIDIDIDVDVFSPGVIVFNIGTGPITIAPRIGPIGGGGDDGGGGGPPPGDIGDPSAPEDTGDDGVASGCAPDGSVLAGVKINILEPLPQVSQYDEQVWRGACYVYMGVPGNLALHPEGVALRDGQFFLPQVENLTCYEVRANTGFNLRVTPYYRALESDES